MRQLSSEPDSSAAAAASAFALGALFALGGFGFFAEVHAARLHDLDDELVGVERDRHRCRDDEVAHVHLVAHLAARTRRARSRAARRRAALRPRSRTASARGDRRSSRLRLRPRGGAGLRPRPLRRRGRARSRRARACPSPGGAGSAGRARAASSPPILSVITRVRTAAAAQDVLQLTRGHGDRHRVGAEAVDDGGHEALAPESAGRAATRSRCAGSAVRIASGMASSNLRVDVAMWRGRAAGRSRARREDRRVYGPRRCRRRTAR